MKGVVLRQFMDYVETHCGMDILDDALQHPSLAAGGAYTTVGNYPHTDLIMIAERVAQLRGTSVSVLMIDFGAHLFDALAASHSTLTQSFTSCIDMLASIEAVIHRDVRKLYPQAELPFFIVRKRVENTLLTLEYQSSRPFADLAEGLIRGAFVHYGIAPQADLTREDLAANGTHSLFTIQVQPQT